MNLNEIAKRHDVEVIDKGNGHIQLKGKLLVNYYPNSKNKSAYIAGTTKAEKHVTEINAVRMANEVPMNKQKEKRKNNYKGPKNKLLKKHPYCHWCGIKLTKETATIEHIIPLIRGGLNNMNNYALACEPSNKKRGGDMPELK